MLIFFLLNKLFYTILFFPKCNIFLRFFISNRNFYRKIRTLTINTFHTYHSTLQIQQLLCNRKSKPNTFMFTRISHSSLIKLFKQMREMFFFNSNPGINNLKDNKLTLSLAFHFNMTIFSKLNSIANQIIKYLN